MANESVSLFSSSRPGTRMAALSKGVDLNLEIMLLGCITLSHALEKRLIKLKRLTTLPGLYIVIICN